LRRAWGGFEDTLYRFIDREGNILALRPEFTSLVAKSVATRLADHPKPLRLSYCGEVLRYEAPRGGRQREFFQIGVEHIGGEHIQSDAEIILVAIESLKSWAFEGFKSIWEKCLFRHCREDESFA
jgi:ATP phosphoribosyltransferase regulatory subunit